MASSPVTQVWLARRRGLAWLAALAAGTLARPVLAANAQVDEDFGERKPRAPAGKGGRNPVQQELERYANTKASNVAWIAAGGAHTIVVRRDGVALAWGNDDAGQLGDGTRNTTPRPTLVTGGPAYAQVAAGGSFTVAVRRDGSVWVWGQQGVERDPGGKPPEPRALHLPASAQAIAAGGQHALILGADGDLWGWGGNAFGQVGDGSTQARMQPVQVGNDFAAIAAGARHSLGVRRDGVLLAWGDNDFGQRGGGDHAAATEPVAVGEGFALVAAGRNHSLAIRRDGTLWAFGDNRAGQLGDGTTTRRHKPVQVGRDTDWSAIAAGAAFSLGLRGNRLYAWGANDDGQLGIGSTAGAPEPIAVPGEYERIACGARHAVALKRDGSVWAWGASDQGQAGPQRSNVPRPV
jgi:alpha-tubulin suppressor-like RCC1 family protein